MAVFRIERTRDYTVMSNHHLRNANLSLKAKGLLSMMLSLPEDWNYTTRGLAKICKEGVDAIGAALRELEAAGYIVRHKLRDRQGRISDTEYVIYEQPQLRKEFTLAWFKSTWKTMNLMMAIMPTTLLGVLPVGLLLVQNGSISPAELAMGIILSLSIVGPLMKATTFINEAKSMEYAVEAANELLNLPVLPDSGKIVSIPHNDIALKHVTFSYDGSEQNEVLHDVNLELPEGSFTALVGPSGGGKSTIARLIARFWDVTGGNITIGGKNIKELSIRQLSELVSFVTQDNFLFNCSLKENIRLGNPNATDEEVYAAAKAACCDEFIVRLDKGYDTPAGDAGKRLSGGEKQRIAIARAILKNAPIVILDEATAFTDPQNEDKIQKSIMALSKGKTLLVIAHRLSTIQNADQIVVLKKGRIVDCGKQEELLKRCPLYADMWKAHIGAKNWSVSEKKEVAAHV